MLLPYFPHLDAISQDSDISFCSLLLSYHEPLLSQTGVGIKLSLLTLPITLLVKMMKSLFPQPDSTSALFCLKCRWMMREEAGSCLCIFQDCAFWLSLIDSRLSLPMKSHCKIGCCWFCSTFMPTSSLSQGSTTGFFFWIFKNSKSNSPNFISALFIGFQCNPNHIYTCLNLLI